jgi:hypothetical protein
MVVRSAHRRSLLIMWLSTAATLLIANRNFVSSCEPFSSWPRVMLFASKMHLIIAIAHYVAFWILFACLNLAYQVLIKPERQKILRRLVCTHFPNKILILCGIFASTVLSLLSNLSTDNSFLFDEPSEHVSLPVTIKRLCDAAGNVITLFIILVLPIFGSIVFEHTESIHYVGTCCTSCGYPARHKVCPECGKANHIEH